MIDRHQVTLIEYKPLRSEPSVRVLFDLGEVSPNVVKKLHEFKTSGNVSLFICSEEEYAFVLSRLGAEDRIPEELVLRINSQTSDPLDNPPYEPEAEESADLIETS